MQRDRTAQNTFFCKVCKTEREIPALHVPLTRRIAIAGLWAFFFGAVAFFLFEWLATFWTALLTGVLSFLGLDVYYSFKFREELACPVCRFNPLLFRRSPEEAKQQCMEGLEQRRMAFIAKWRALKNRRISKSEGNA